MGDCAQSYRVSSNFVFKECWFKISLCMGGPTILSPLTYCRVIGFPVESNFHKMSVCRITGWIWRQFYSACSGFSHWHSNSWTKLLRNWRKVSLINHNHCPVLTRHRPYACQDCPRVTRHWPYACQDCPRVTRHWPHACQDCPRVTRHWPYACQDWLCPHN